MARQTARQQAFEAASSALQDFLQTVMNDRNVNYTANIVRKASNSLPGSLKYKSIPTEFDTQNKIRGRN